MQLAPVRHAASGIWVFDALMLVLQLFGSGRVLETHSLAFKSPALRVRITAGSASLGHSSNPVHLNLSLKVPACLGYNTAALEAAPEVIIHLAALIGIQL